MGSHRRIAILLPFLHFTTVPRRRFSPSDQNVIIDVVAIISDGGVAERISHMGIHRTEDLFVEMYKFRTPANGASADDVCAVMIPRGNDKFLEASGQAPATS